LNHNAATTANIVKVKPNICCLFLAKLFTFQDLFLLTNFQYFIENMSISVRFGWNCDNLLLSDLNRFADRIYDDTHYVMVKATLPAPTGDIRSMVCLIYSSIKSIIIRNNITRKCSYFIRVGRYKRKIMRNTINAGIIMPVSFVNQIDMVRGDVCRSRFVLRAVEKYLKDKEMEAKREIE
jgi:hypothetical protein